MSQEFVLLQGRG